MVTGVSFTGLASGLQTDEIIEQLMHLERAPMRKMEGRRAEREAQREAWGDINAQLSALDSLLNPLRSTSTFESRIVDSSNEDIVTASADDAAPQAVHEIEVQQLAAAHRVASERQASTEAALDLSGSFLLAGAEIEISVDDGLLDIRDAINAEDVGVRASIVDNRLVLSAENTGVEHFVDLVDGEEGILGPDQLGLLESVEAAVATEEPSVGAVEAGTEYEVVHLPEPVEIAGETYSFALAENGEFAALSIDGTAYFALEESVGEEDLAEATLLQEDFTFGSAVRSGRVSAAHSDGQLILSGYAARQELVAPADAVFIVDGLEVTAGQNAGISGVIEGVTLNLHGISSGSPTRLDIGRDTAGTVGAVQDFVDKYNQVAAQLRGLGERDALLSGDGTLRRLTDTLRTTATDRVSFGDGDLPTSLAQVGITVDRHGVMSLDADELGRALDESAEGVRILFDGSEERHGADGVARRLQSQLNAYLRSGDGLLHRTDRMYENMISQIDGRMEGLERRLERRERTLRRQFARMEEALSEMQNQGVWLDGQISSLMGGGDR